MSAAVQEVKDRLYAQLYRVPPQGDLVGTVFPVRSSRAMLADQFGRMNFRDRASFTRGDSYLPVTGGEDHSLVPWESWVYVSVGGGIEITFTHEMGSGHFSFAPAPPRRLPGMRSMSRIQELEPQAVVARVVHETPDRYHPFRETIPLDFYYDLAGFRGAGGLTRLDVAYALPSEAFSKHTRSILKLSAALTSPSHDRVYRKAVRVQGVEQAETGLLFTELLSLDVPPGTYRLTVKAQNHSANKTGIYKQEMHIASYAGETLQISDLALAAEIGEAIGESRFQKGDLEVVPLPTRTFEADQQLGVYYEIYNLKPDPFGQRRYRVTVHVKSEAEAAGIRRLLPGSVSKPEVSLTYEQLAGNATEQIHLFVDLTRVLPGRNRLTVTVEDMVSNQTATREAVFQYGK